ncbi:MAG: (2Fe-2S)-binding protein [Chloroflexota bacterium]
MTAIDNSMNHPFPETVCRVNQFLDFLDVQFDVPNRPNWIEPKKYFAPNSTKLATMRTETQQRLRTDAANIVGSSILQAYQWPIIVVAIASYLLDQRVPDLSLDNVRLNFVNQDNIVKIGLQSGRFTALPSDPARDHPDATVVINQDALRLTLRTEIENHLGLIIEQLCCQFGAHPRGLWLAVSDRCASTLIWLMQEIDGLVDPPTIENEIDLLMKVPGTLLYSKPIGLFTLTYAENTYSFSKRATCCYLFKVKENSYCATCPRLKKRKRTERLLSYMAQKYGAAKPSRTALSG